MKPFRFASLATAAVLVATTAFASPGYGPGPAAPHPAQGPAPLAGQYPQAQGRDYRAAPTRWETPRRADHRPPAAAEHFDRRPASPDERNHPAPAPGHGYGYAASHQLPPQERPR